MSLYSIKMRASEKKKHISGSEKIINYDQIDRCVKQLIQRGMRHPKGNPDLLNIKVEKIEQENILYLDALPVSTIEVENYQDGIEEIRKFLILLNLKNAEKIVSLLSQTYAMRGAILLDVDTMERLEPDRERGIRATYMDAERTYDNLVLEGKNHYEEAIVLATKVANAPNIIGEICISDDPDYVTGYVASKSTGYRRITKMKEMGSENGGRIFLYQGSKEDVAGTISFLEKQPVIVKNVKPLHLENRCADKFAFIDEELQNLQDQHLYRSMKTIHSAQTSTVICNGREMIMMASNNYLDMSCVDEVKKYAASILEKYGTGSGGSRLTTGNTDIHEMLEEKIRVNPCCKGLVVSDAVFSMDGDILNLPQFVQTADRYHLLSMIDEAHSTGVIGRTGRGIVEYFNNLYKPDIIMGTLSKAVGSEGGFVCGSKKLIEYLKNKARGFIFSTSLSPVSMASSFQALDYMEKNPQRVTMLQENVQFFCNYLREKGLDVHSETAIIPILIGDEQKALEISQKLFDKGIFLSAIRYPTVKKGSARLRVALMATHTKDQLKKAADAIISEKII